MSDPEDYTIGWISALALEYTVAQVQLDEEHDPPKYVHRGDENHYTLGSIGRHKVVLAVLGAGENGVAAAAMAAKDMMHSFPNVRFCVMVGIGGGAPSKEHDIRLGDVVVSTPTFREKNYGGVVHYDFAATLKAKSFQSLHYMNQPPRACLAAVNAIIAKHRGEGNGIDANISDILEKKPRLRREYGRPEASTDRLYISDSIPIENSQPDGSNAETHATRLIQRDPRLEDEDNPAVHYGLIASADGFMKDAEIRDILAGELGVLCFEMEAAGLMNQFPCLVIRGICDYSDAHWSKGWRGYAAMSAATYAKDLITETLSYRLESEVGIGKLLDKTPQPVLELPAGPWFLVPYPRNDTFVGRTSILQTLQQLLKPPNRARTSLFGLGGTGKTQIALEYAYMSRETCLDMSVFWVHGNNAERFGQSYTSIALECRIPGYNDPKVQVLPLVKTWLERQDRKPWLMVIDNADDAELFFPPHQEQRNASSGTQEKCLGQYVPECARGSILITSRNKQAGQKIAKGTRPIKVNKMDDAEAIRLLRASLEDQNHALGDDEFLTLARRLEHLPLALVQAAAFIEANTMAIGRYIHLLEKSDQDQVYLLSKEFETVGRDSETPHAVAETWILSFLQIQQQNLFASELFSLMNFFDRQAIPIKFLEYYNEQQNQEGYSEIQLQESLGILKAFSFVTEGQDQSLDIHRLVQLISRKWLTREKKLEHFANQALSVISQAYPVGAYKNWITCGKYLPHAYQVLKFEVAISKDEKIGKGVLLHRMALYLLYQGQWNDAERLQLEAVELRMEVLGADHPSTLTSMANLASTYRNQGRWEEAEKLDVQVMETRKAKLGAGHPDTLTSMGNLASTFWNQGRWDEAEKLEVQVMETRKAKLGADHPSTLTSMANLASTYRNQGRWDEAEKLDVQVMETRKAELGAGHPDTLTSMANLASTFWNQGRWDEAEKLDVQVMETRKAKLGADHPDTLTSLNNLAHTWKNMGKNSAATELMLDCVRLRQRKLGLNHPDTQSSSSSLYKWSGNQLDRH